MTPHVRNILWSGWEDLTPVWEVTALIAEDTGAADADELSARVIVDLSDRRWIEVGLYEGWPAQRLVRPLRGPDLIDHLRQEPSLHEGPHGPTVCYETTDEGLRAYADATGWHISP